MANVTSRNVLLSAVAGAAVIAGGCATSMPGEETSYFLPGSDDGRRQGQIASYLDRSMDLERTSSRDQRRQDKQDLTSTTSTNTTTTSEMTETDEVTTTQAQPVAPTRGVIDSRPNAEVVFRSGELTFKTDSSELTSDGRQEIERVGAILSASEDRNVVIEGHADARGSKEYNLDLSRRRAESVRSALIEMGVSDRQVSIRPRGEERPVASNDTQEGRAQNRRVEIRPAG